MHLYNNYIIFCFIFVTEEPTTTPQKITTTAKATLPTRAPDSSPLQRPLFVPRSDYDFNLVREQYFY